MRTWMMVAVAVVGVSCCGCRRGGADRVAVLEARVAQLEQANAKLRTTPLTPDVTVVKAPVLPVIATQALLQAVAASVNGVVSNEVAAQLDRRVGSQADINAIFQQAIREGVASYDERKNSEREEQRKQWQTKMEDQRKQWEEKRTQRLAEELKLSAEQSESMKKLEIDQREAVRKKIEEMGGMGGFNFEAMRTATEELRVKNDEEVAKILTPEQMEEYKKRPRNMMSLLSGMFGGMQPPGAGGGAAPAPATP